MLNNLITNSLPPESSTNDNLTCFQMWGDGIKATKLLMDPLSDYFGYCLGAVCCIAVAVTNDEHDRKTPATRYDVTHAAQIRRNEAEQANLAYVMGSCVGNALVDTISVTAGIYIGGARATFFTCTGNNDRKNTVFGKSRQDIDNVKLFDSCLDPACCKSSNNTASTPSVF